MFHFQQDIATELELLSSSGKLFVERPKKPTSSSAKRGENSNAVNHCSQSLDHRQSSLDDFREDFEDEVESDDDHEDTSIQIERMVHSVSDCFLHCFKESPFTIGSFVSLSNAFFTPEDLSPSSSRARDILKSKVITRLIKKVFVSIALSKSHIDKMNE